MTKIEHLAHERLNHIQKGLTMDSPKPDIDEVTAMPSIQAAPAKPPHRTLTRHQNYHSTLNSLHRQMHPARRRFSRFIHLPLVEDLSDFLAVTLFRPSITLGATVTALVFTGFLYGYARIYGFELRGSELWLSLLLGGTVGYFTELFLGLVQQLRNK